VKGEELRTVRILVVEDEVQLAEQLGLALSGAGYAVDHAADGERGNSWDERRDTTR
jgi:DNA-binding response OmpR family regulator